MFSLEFKCLFLLLHFGAISFKRQWTPHNPSPTLTLKDPIRATSFTLPFVSVVIIIWIFKPPSPSDFLGFHFNNWLVIHALR